MTTDTLKQIYERAALCRAFEDEVARRIEDGTIKAPCYLSTGEEYIPATISTWLDEHGLHFAKRQVFPQHRAHSTYLCYGGRMDDLVLELLGDPRGCSGGMGGSNCPQSKTANIYGHDALLGTNAPIAVGACFANHVPTICILGDAAVEEDYVFPAFGFASTHKLPIFFVVENNGLAILTPIEDRRQWNIVSVARGFGINTVDITDDPIELYQKIPDISCWPVLFDIQTTRLRWHSGPGRDDQNAFDRHKQIAKIVDLSAEIQEHANKRVKEIWNQYTKQANFTD